MKSLRFSQKQKTGELVRQAERKSSNFDPLPDADNAAVGSRFFGFFTGGTLGPPVFLHYLRKGERRPRMARRAEGERPEPCIAAMGSRVPA